MEIHVMEAVKKLIKKLMGTYPQVRKKYYEDVFAAVYDYLDSDKQVTTYRNAMNTAIATAFLNTGDIAWEDGGGELPIEQDVLDWLIAAQEAENANAGILFQNLRAIRGQEDLNKFEYASARANGYASTLDRIYSYIKIAAGKDIMLTLVGDDGEKSCEECQKYKGKRHKASWWVKRNLVPGIGSAYSCGGWRCQHTLVDDSGKIWSL